MQDVHPIAVLVAFAFLTMVGCVVCLVFANPTYTPTAGKVPYRMVQHK